MPTASFRSKESWIAKRNSRGRKRKPTRSAALSPVTSASSPTKTSSPRRLPKWSSRFARRWRALPSNWRVSKKSSASWAEADAVSLPQHVLVRHADAREHRADDSQVALVGAAQKEIFEVRRPRPLL